LFSGGGLVCFDFGTWDEMSANGAGVKKQLSFVGLASDNGDALTDDGDGFWVAGKKT
jgi:hypothetical protein